MCLFFSNIFLQNCRGLTVTKENQTSAREWASQMAQQVRNPPAMEETQDVGSVPGWGRSPREGNGNPLQYSFLESPSDRGIEW